MTLTALAIGVVVPLVNVLAVGALAGLGSGARGGAAGFFRAVLANPLILACVAGAAANVTGLDLPGTLDVVFDLAGKAALLLGLMSVGAALEPSRLVHDVKPLTVTCLLKLALSPAVTALAALALGVTGLAFKAAVLYAALPVSASAYVLAARMGGDRALMAGALTATTVLAAASLPRCWCCSAAEPENPRVPRSPRPVTGRCRACHDPVPDYPCVMPPYGEAGRQKPAPGQGRTHWAGPAGAGPFLWRRALRRRGCYGVFCGAGSRRIDAVPRACATSITRMCSRRPCSGTRQARRSRNARRRANGSPLSVPALSAAPSRGLSSTS